MEDLGRGSLDFGGSVGAEGGHDLGFGLGGAAEGVQELAELLLMKRVGIRVDRARRGRAGLEYCPCEGRWSLGVVEEVVTNLASVNTCIVG